MKKRILATPAKKLRNLTVSAPLHQANRSAENLCIQWSLKTIPLLLLGAFALPAYALNCSSGTVTGGGDQAVCSNTVVNEDIVVAAGNTLTLSNFPNWGVGVNQANAGKITNDGSIVSAGSGGGRGIGTNKGLSMAGVVNTGTINVSGHGVELNTGKITGFEDTGLYDAGKIALYNSGSITGTKRWEDSSGFRISGGSSADGSVVNTAAGSITGGVYGINLAGTDSLLSGAVVNAGKIEGEEQSGIRNLGTIDSEIINSGDITGGEFGIDNRNRIVGITNTGTIQGVTKNGIENFSTTDANGAIDYIQNSGSQALIEGGVSGITLEESTAIGSIINRDGAKISGTEQDGITNRGVITTVNNGSAILGGTTGVYVAATGSIQSITNQGSGQIEGGKDGITNEGTITLVENDGLINGSGSKEAGDGIYNGGTITTVNNQSKIKGVTAGVYNDALITSLNNAENGTIKGTYNGIFNQASTAVIDAVNNQGTVEADTTGIYNQGTINTIANGKNAEIKAKKGIHNANTIGVMNNQGMISSTDGSI
ncbi:hypothetical protein, partial [Snodgrassella sp. CFCC 13594]|uniref:beta strand repeat-containing protein n=1 Tax=Snodgrassella sp. CFCC 13594 TaxID=1775559 RepID=UPI000ADF9DA4